MAYRCPPCISSSSFFHNIRFLQDPPLPPSTTCPSLLTLPPSPVSSLFCVQQQHLASVSMETRGTTAGWLLLPGGVASHPPSAPFLSLIEVCSTSPESMNQHGDVCLNVNQPLHQARGERVIDEISVNPDTVPSFCFAHRNELLIFKKYIQPWGYKVK